MGTDAGSGFRGLPPKVSIAPAESVAKPSGRRTLSIVSVLFLVVVVYLGSTFTPGLQDDADSTHAEVAREMSVTHDYVTLKVNGNRYLEKAPLMYWLVSFSYTVFGVNEFATRLPTLLAILGLTILGMKWARRAFGDRASVYAGMFVATAAGYYLFTRILIPEAILSLFIACSFYCFLTALEHGHVWRWYGGYACLALAVLTKGLLALVVVGFAMLLYLALSGDWRRWRQFRIFTGLLLFVAIAAPWHLLAGFRNTHFFWFYFVNEHFLRFLGKRIPKDYNKQEGSLYWSLHLIWLFPWSLYLPAALRRPLSEWITRRKQGVHEAKVQVSTFRSRTELVCLIWASVILVFFSFSTNQEYYTFPAYLPILLLIAGELVREEERSNRWLLWTSGVTAAISIAFSAVLFIGLWSSRHLPFVPDIGTVLAKPNPEADTLSMGHILDLTWTSFAALRLPTVLAAVILLTGPLLALWFRARKRHAAAMWTTACTAMLFLVAAHIALVRFDTYLGSKVIAADLAPQLRPNDRVIIYGDQAYGSSLLFYLQRPIELVNGKTTGMWFGSTYPDAPHIWINDSDLRQAWNSPTRVFLFVPPHEREHVEKALPFQKFYVVTEHSGKIVYSNR